MQLCPFRHRKFAQRKNAFAISYIENQSTRKESPLTLTFSCGRHIVTNVFSTPLSLSRSHRPPKRAEISPESIYIEESDRERKTPSLSTKLKDRASRESFARGRFSVPEQIYDELFSWIRLLAHSKIKRAMTKTMTTMMIIGSPQFWRLGRPPVDRCFQGLRFPFRDCTARMYRIGIIVRAIQSTGRSLVRGKVRTDKVQALIDCQPRSVCWGERKSMCVCAREKTERESECILQMREKGNGDRERRRRRRRDRSLSMRENLAKIPSTRYNSIYVVEDSQWWVNFRSRSRRTRDRAKEREGEGERREYRQLRVRKEEKKRYVVGSVGCYRELLKTSARSTSLKKTSRTRRRFSTCLYFSAI